MRLERLSPAVSQSGSPAASPGRSGGFGHRAGRAVAAFTLIEVMVAIAIFAVAVFAILDLTSRNLRNARALQRTELDIGGLAAELSLTNSLEEGTETGDFGDLYPGSTWRRDAYLYASNGLYQVDFQVFWNVDGRSVESQMSMLLYRYGGVVRPGGGAVRR